ncbi:hypothetical protein ACFUN7_06285 [Streptomyces sp. NPDC057236]|uniref:hypothetical protein n=1 Tax=Streptomyces sp. NPDC057236 TaxID=3346059 RepID=UPI003628E128
MWTAVARATTWRVMGDLDQAAAAFGSALALDRAIRSLHLDLVDVRAEQGDFAAAARTEDVLPRNADTGCTRPEATDGVPPVGQADVAVIVQAVAGPPAHQRTAGLTPAQRI